MRVSIGLFVLAACTRHHVATPQPFPTTTRVIGALEPFAAGVMKRTISEHTYGDLWEGTSATLELVRDGALVCSVPDGGHGAGCLDSWSDGVGISVVSDQPLRFSAREVRTSGRELWHGPGTCVGYEISPNGRCRQVFEHNCDGADRCTTNVVVARRPGSGRIVVTSSAWATVLLDRTIGEASAQIVDATSTVMFEAGVGIHVLEIFTDGAQPPELVPPSWLAPYEDLDVFVDHRCHCCEF